MRGKQKKSYYVSDVVERWLYLNEYQVSRATHDKYEQLVQNYIEPYFREVSVEELDEEHLRAFYHEIHHQTGRTQKSLSQGNQRTIFMIINHSLNYAYNSKLTEQQYTIRPHLSKSRNVVRVFSELDLKKLELYAQNHWECYSLAIMLAMFTGLRIGEICALQWKDLDLKAGSLQVSKTVQRLKVKENPAHPEGVTGSKKVSKTELVVSEPKSAASHRLLPLTESILCYLKTFPQREPDAFVLTNQAEKPMEPRTLQYHFKKILYDLNIPYLNFHCLRHTFATRCVTMGCDVKTLSEILGHFDIKVTMEYYFHSSFEYKKQQLEKISTLSQN